MTELRRQTADQSIFVICHILKFHTSIASGQKTTGLIKEKKPMNIEHRTSNIEHRIMYSVGF